MGLVQHIFTNTPLRKLPPSLLRNHMPPTICRLALSLCSPLSSSSTTTTITEWTTIRVAGGYNGQTSATNSIEAPSERHPYYSIYVSTMLEWAFGVEGKYEKVQAKDREAFRRSPGLYSVWNTKPYFLDEAVKNDNSRFFRAVSIPRSRTTTGSGYRSGRNTSISAGLIGIAWRKASRRGQHAHGDASRRAYILPDVHDSRQRVEVVARKRWASRFWH